MESRANGRVKRCIYFFHTILFEAINSGLSSVTRDIRALPLLDPGVLNCDESRSLRGVDMLLPSNTGSGDVSLPVELQADRRGREEGEQNCRGETQPHDCM